MILSNIEILKLILSRYVVIFGGRYSRGKSLSLTALNFFDIMLNGRNNFISNMPVKYPINHKVVPLISTSQFDGFENIINIIYDEIHLDLNARNFNSIVNKYINIFGRDIAKIDGRLRGSVQFFDTLEKVIGLLLEVTILPEYVNKYSNDTKEDNRLRLEHKDFIMKWIIHDNRENEDYELILNLYPFIFMYNTKFKTQPMFLNHKEYVQNIKEKKPKEFKFYEERKKDEILVRLNNWNTGYLEIGKELIR